MKKAALLLVALCPITAFGQLSVVSKLVRLHYVQPDVIRSLVQPGGNVTIAANNALKAVVVHGSPDNVAEAEKLIQQLDVPPPEASARNVEVTVYVIGATNKSASQAAAVPQNVEPVVRQLKAIFPYSNFALLDSMLIRSREGAHSSTSGVLRDFPSQSAESGPPSTYIVDYHLSPPDASGTSRTIHFADFWFRGHERSAHGMTGVDLRTNLDLPEGQKIVVGKTDIDNGDSALFVVLSARIEPKAAR